MRGSHGGARHDALHSLLLQARSTPAASASCLRLRSCSSLQCLQRVFPFCTAPAPPPPPPHMQPVVWPAPHTAATSREAGPLQDLQHARNTGLNGLFSARKAAGGASDAGSLGGTRRPVTSRALDVSQPHQVELQAQSISRKCGLSAKEE
jgi:hypothetical protein